MLKKMTLLVAMACSGIAMADVVLYGQIKGGIGYTSGDGDGSITQIEDYKSRIGFRGNEDLGNGLSATFQLEGRFDGSTGSKSVDKKGKELAFFDRESTVGLKGNFGHVRVGRSLATMERGLGFVNIGRRIADISPYASAARHSNGLFYTYTNNAFEVGADVTTKGGYAGNTNESTVDAKAAYGV